MPERSPALVFLVSLGLLAGLLTLPAGAAEPARPGIRAGAAALADSLLAGLPQRTARVLEFKERRGRLNIGRRAGIETWSTLTFQTGNGESPPAHRTDFLGPVEIETLADDELTFKLRGSEGEGRIATGQTVRVYLERHTLALAAPGSPDITQGAVHRFMAALREQLETPALRIVAMPSLGDSSEAQQMARAGNADLYGWAVARAGAGSLWLGLDLFRTKDGRPLAPLRVSITRDGGLDAPADISAGEDPAAALPGARPTWTSEALPGAVLELFPRRFMPGVVDAFFTDRIESWRLAGARLERWQSYALDPIWPPAAGTRWPLAALLPINSYYNKDRSESRVFYALCSNQRPRYLSINVRKDQPDSLNLALSDGPQDTLNGCTGSCFAQVDRVERSPHYHRPAGLPRTAAARLALGRVDLGPSGLPAYDEKGYVKTRRSAIVFYDLASATLWLAAADTAFQVPGRFGDEIDAYRVGRAGPPGFLVSSATAAGQPDRLQFWVWENGALTRRWQSDPFAGSITALQVVDLDGDAREDLLVAETLGQGPEARARYHLYEGSLETAGGTP